MESPTPYGGVVVPMVTPFTPEGEVDAAAAARIAEHLASAGTSVFVLGTTGEAPSIDLAGRARLVAAVVRQNAGRTVTYAGISDNCLAVSTDLARRFADLGAEVAVAHVPSFYPLADEDVLRYFDLLADRSPLPLMLYNMPSLTKTTLSLNVVDRLSRHPRIVGMKDSQNDAQRLAEALALWKNRPDFAHLTGCAVLSMAALSLGSKGIVPSAANLAPGLFMRLCEAVRAGDMDLAGRLQARADGIAEIYAKGRPLSQSLPILKAMMHVRGLCGPHVLAPLRTVPQEKILEIRHQWPAIQALLDQP